MSVSPKSLLPAPKHLDQMGREVRVPASPQRIVSLVPSQTELLFDLGLEEQVIGLTKFCIYPEGKHKEKTQIGGTKQFKFDVIDQLQPDLIIGNKEENYEEGINQLTEQYPVWMSDIHNLTDALDMIRGMGSLTGTTPAAEKIVAEITQGFAGLPPVHLLRKVAYFIWKDPYMSIGHDTFIQDMLNRSGFTNVFGDQTRYPVVSAEALAQAAPDLILLSSEPYPFQEKHLAEFSTICPGAKVLLVDGELFSWYGSRLRLSPSYFGELQNLLSR